MASRLRKAKQAFCTIPQPWTLSLATAMALFDMCQPPIATNSHVRNSSDMGTAQRSAVREPQQAQGRLPEALLIGAQIVQKPESVLAGGRQTIRTRPTGDAWSPDDASVRAELQTLGGENQRDQRGLLHDTRKRRTGGKRRTSREDTELREALFMDITI